MTAPEIRLGTSVVRTPEQVSGSLDGQVVLLSVETGHYYDMNEQASRIWELIEHPALVSDVIDRLLAEFEVARAECEADVLRFLNALLQDGLVQVVA